ncbi:MAG: formylglycine-generating enzyme family protein [Bacteroidales bacterium]|nr:formylglycine-generating enzyme family protein [Bacteroidales bacterium]
MKILNILSVCLILLVYSVVSSCDSTPFADKDFEVNGVKFRMIAVEGGSYMMGATPGQGEDARENEKPAHKVTVDDFYIGETEVTQELWFAVMGNNPSLNPSDQGNYPVENVSWKNVQVFITKLNDITGQQFRLPFEEEWEYAARGGKNTTDKKYAGSDDIGEVAWYNENSNDKTHAVASKKANELGIYDMSGNVWEFCELSSDVSICNIRGGSVGNKAQFLRTSSRYHLQTKVKNYSVGFRLILDILNN